MCQLIAYNEKALALGGKVRNCNLPQTVRRLMPMRLLAAVIVFKVF